MSAGTEVNLGESGRQHVLLGGVQHDESPLLLGVSVVAAEQTTALIEHDLAEVAFVLSGDGWLVTEDDGLAFSPGDALLIGAHRWHAIRAGNAEVRMLYVFPSPDVPPTRTMGANE